MKLSKILGWPEKEELSLVSPSDYDMSQLADDTHKYIRDLEILTENQDTALTLCDREIDREALANVIIKWIGYDSEFSMQNSKELSEVIISTMPKWLKRSEK